jgi:hypothetical protein
VIGRRRVSSDTTEDQTPETNSTGASQDGSGPITEAIKLRTVLRRFRGKREVQSLSDGRLLVSTCGRHSPTNSKEFLGLRQIDCRDLRAIRYSECRIYASSLNLGSLDSSDCCPQVLPGIAGAAKKENKRPRYVESQLVTQILVIC